MARPTLGAMQRSSELHVGTFTPGGTFRAAIDKLDHVRETGRDRDRTDADRRLRRPPKLGLRRRPALCAG